jgi:thimet oligopeptidase
MKRILPAFVAASLAGCAGHAPTPQVAQAPVKFPVLDAASIKSTCDAALADGRAAVAALESKAGGAGFLAEWNAMQIALEDRTSPISLMLSLHPEKAVRDAAEPCLQKANAFNTELFQNEKIYRRVVAVEPADAREAKLKKNLVEGFEDSGVALPADKRARAREISARLEEIRQAFERNGRDDATRVVVKPGEAAGLPESFLKTQSKDAEGNYVLKPDDPTSFVVLNTASNEDVRKRFYVASMNRGGMQNLKLLEEAYTLRRERAQLQGLPSFAHMVLKRRMAGSPEAVNKFLDDVSGAVTSVERAEIAELAKAKAEETKTPLAQVKVNRWDGQYYTERVKRARFNVDQEQVRKHFPSQPSVEYALLIAETLYGIKFREAQAPVWHPDVKYYEIFDAASGEYLANLYVDLYAREGKRSGAFASNVRRASTLAGRKPQSVLVCNFTKDGLNQRQMETLLHEFGHALHGVLSKAKYVTQAGTSVKRDFVEAPSQMFEEWVRKEQPLALYRKVCADCPPLARADIERLEGARKFGRGMGYARQWMYAKLDMTLSLEPQPVAPLWKKLETESPLGHLEGTMKPTNFQHIAGSGYASGYYGYMWSEVIALDLLSPFAPNMLDPKVGSRYRDVILANGSQEEEMDMVRKFLGRDPNPKAFFDEITGKR